MRNIFSFIFILLITISCGTAQKAMVYEEGHTYTLDDYKEIFNYYNVVDSIINNKKFHDDSLKYITEINDIKNKIEDIDIIYYKFACKNDNENYYEKLCAEKTASLRQILREKEINFINFLSTKYYIYTFPLEHLCYYDINQFTESWRYTKSYIPTFFIDFQTYTTNILIQPQGPEKIPSEYYTSYVKEAGKSFYVKDKWGIKWECFGKGFISEDAMIYYGHSKYTPKFYIVIYYINKSEYKYSMGDIEKSITEFKNCTDKTQQEKLYKEIIWRIHNNNLDNRKRKINTDELERLKEYLFDTNIIDQ